MLLLAWVISRYVAIAQIKPLLAMMNATVASIDTKLPNDPDVAKLKGSLAMLSKSMDSVTKGINTANQNYDVLTGSLTKLNGGIKTIIANTGSNSKLVTGISELEKGEASLATGLRQGSAGQKTVIDSMAKLDAGAAKIKAGQDTLYTGLNSLTGGITQLKSGISKSQGGLSTIHTGINKSNNFLTQLTGTKSFYISLEELEETRRKEKKRGKTKAVPRGVANKEMCTFLILNISSLQLIPVNIIAYRSQYGSVNPVEIVGPAIVATVISTISAAFFCKFMEKHC